MRCCVFLAVLVLLAGSAAPALAQYARGPVRSGDIQPLDEILEGIRNSRPGSFYDADGPFRGPDGRMHYRIKWLTPEGRVIWLDTDAQSGRVLGVERGGPRRPAWDRGGEEPRPPRFVPDRDRFEDDGGDDRRNDRFWPGQYDRRDRNPRAWHNGPEERGGFRRRPDNG